jgi:hypothetical protein
MFWPLEKPATNRGLLTSGNLLSVSERVVAEVFFSRFFGWPTGSGFPRFGRLRRCSPQRLSRQPSKQHTFICPGVFLFLRSRCSFEIVFPPVRVSQIDLLSLPLLRGDPGSDFT